MKEIFSLILNAVKAKVHISIPKFMRDTTFAGNGKLFFHSKVLDFSAKFTHQAQLTHCHQVHYSTLLMDSLNATAFQLRIENPFSKGPHTKFGQ